MWHFPDEVSLSHPLCDDLSFPSNGSSTDLRQGSRPESIGPTGVAGPCEDTAHAAIARWFASQESSIDTETPPERGISRDLRQRREQEHDPLTGLHPGQELVAFGAERVHGLSTPSSPSPAPEAIAPSATPPDFNADLGYGLVDAAAAVAAAMGRPSLKAIADGGQSWNHTLINAPQVWANGITGEGVVVAVVDSGVDITHSDLNQTIWRNDNEIAGNGIDDDGNGYIDDVNGWDFVDDDNNPRDKIGHGTHVAGIIAAERNGVGITGVAHGAEIMPIKVIGDNNFGSVRATAEGIRYAADNGADVINLSIGTAAYSYQLDRAIRYATEQGAIVVSSAGNASLDQPGYPAQSATQSGFSVGAIERDRKLASFSNRAGANRDLHHVVAPGVAIPSTLPDDAYGLSSGTSMAAPHVAGVVALMLSANPSLTHEKVREIVINTTA